MIQIDHLGGGLHGDSVDMDLVGIREIGCGGLHCNAHEQGRNGLHGDADLFHANGLCCHGEDQDCDDLGGEVDGCCLCGDAGGLDCDGFHAHGDDGRFHGYADDLDLDDLHGNAGEFHLGSLHGDAESPHRDGPHGDADGLHGDEFLPSGDSGDLICGGLHGGCSGGVDDELHGGALACDCLHDDLHGDRDELCCAVLLCD